MPLNLEYFKHPLLQLIDVVCIEKYHESFRNHIGASKIGGLCDREIWYSFRWVFDKVHNGPAYRRFERGRLEEKRIKDYLEMIGFEYETEQKSFSYLDGHFCGTCDGIVLVPVTKERMLLEVKTTKGGADFKNLFSLGAKEFKPVHYAQMCVYGEALGLKEALYISVNKQNEEIYAEALKLDWNKALDLKDRAHEIINSQELPNKWKNASSTLYLCKMCSHYPLCFENQKAQVNCRSCKFAIPIENAEWKCIRYDATIEKEFLRKGCEQWETIL